MLVKRNRYNSGDNSDVNHVMFHIRVENKSFTQTIILGDIYMYQVSHNWRCDKFVK